MAELVYSEEALYREAPTSTIHELDGVRMHGGFDDEGSYVYLIYRIDDDFEYARLKHLGKLIAARLEPE